VGPRHLITAAHCVFNASSLDLYYDATHDVQLRFPNGQLATYKVKQAHVHPLWSSKCADTLCSASAVTAKLDAPDVAVLELEDEPKDLATAKVDRTPLAPGDLVRVTGFGCTTGVHVTDQNVAVALRTAEQNVVAPSAAVHDGSFVTAADEPIYAGNYAFTAGKAGLCPGDSGGPLYRAGAVVGVNANYTLRPDDQDEVGIPVTNWHTRLDGNSRNHVGEWLSELGIP
jgi:secreted trypsin-like serine protease